MTCLYFQKLKKLCKYNYSLPIYDHFCAILSKFWPKILAKISILHILEEIQLVPEENLLEFVTLDTSYYMSNKADRLVQKCSKFIFKCLKPQLVPNGMMRVEWV